MDAGPKQLLDAISASPGDDAPRMVYADWLLESGDRLGELIVAQLEQVLRPDDPELNERIARLISAHQGEVIGDLPLSKPVFRRGFVEAAEISAGDFAHVGPLLLERLPLLRELVIWLERQVQTEALCASPHLGHLRALSLRYGRNCRIDALGLNPALTQLERLELTGCEVGLPGCEVLAASPHLTSLRALEIGSDVVEAAGVLRLSRASFAAQLRRLRLWKTKLGSQGVSTLRAFTALEALDLGFNELGQDGLEALADLAPSLRTLGLRGNRITARGVAALAPLTLTHLDLEGARIGDAGISELAKLELGQLETLNLSGNQLSAAGVRRLIELPLPKLRRLVLRRNELQRGPASLATKLTHARIELDAMVHRADR